MKYQVLMCAPRHYALQYEINPWMKLSNPIDGTKAASQWNFLRRALQKLGVTVVTVPQKEGYPDMVFTANAGVSHGRTFIPSHFRFKQRRGEEPAFIHHFKQKGYKIKDSAKGLFFEGEGDLLPYRDILFGGYGYRSEIRAHERVAKAFGKRLISLKLATPSFYHLDTCFCPLDENTALYYPYAFDARGRKAIQREIRHLISVSKEDAYHFACNAFRIGKIVLLNRASAKLKKQLEAVGYRTLETPTSEFIKAGGSVKCLILVQ